LTYWLASRLVKTPYVSLPNLLVGKRVVEELIQDDATAQRLATEVMKFLGDSKAYSAMIDQFGEIHRQLRRDANERAADAVLALMGVAESDNSETGT